ncbi:MAG TPA: hypothetical protein VEJ87_00440, partial [Acidimicrobiales bacterium]|nr:hypothetical protein [Acidimicrobiales bacterium]
MKVKVAFLCGVSAMALAAADSGSSAVEAATHRTDARATVSTSAGTMTVDLPATSQEFGTRFSSETSYPGFLSNMTPPGDGYPNVSQRLDSSNLDVWRVQGGDGYNTLTTTLPSPCNYTSKTHQTVSAWNFTGADNTLSEGPTGAPREFDLTAPPDCLFTGSAPLGGNGKAQGALADQSYDAMATWAADVVKYFRTGILISDSGNTVSYTSNSLTDTDQDFSAYGGGGYSVTATVDNANGFSDWETAVVTSVSGPNDDTLNFSAGWSDADSYDVAAQDSLLETTTPEDGAAYNLASTTPPAGLTSPEVATPWPCPPSVGNVEYIELVNEPDLSNYNEPRISPAMPPPAPTVTGANVPGGTLTVGKQYSYRITAMDTRGDESKPGSQVSVTLPAGDNAVHLSWSATSNLGLSPAAYRIYGRTSGTEKAMVVVGSTNPDGLNWTDTGGVVPSGAMPKKNNTVGSQVFAPETYLKMWNVVAPAIKAVDPTVKLVGPTISNAQSVCGCDDVLTNVVTTGPSDDSYLNTEDYIPVLMSGANPKPDVISFHAYGDYEGTSSTEADYWSGLQNEISNFVSVDQAAVGSTPVWIDETNIDAGFFGSEPSATDMRAMTQMGSAWLADSVIQWATQAP